MNVVRIFPNTRGLRAYRALAFKNVLKQQSRGPSNIWGSNAALLLTAAAPWFLNGLHSVPDNGPCSRDLMGKILPLINRVGVDIDILAYPASTGAVRATFQDLLGSDDDVDDTASESDIPIAPNRLMRRAGEIQTEMLPCNPYGMLFLREIRIGGGTLVPRFAQRNIRMLTDKSFKYIFGITREQMDHQVFQALLATYLSRGGHVA